MLHQLGFDGHLTRTTISAYELGTGEPLLPVLLKYARLGGVSTDVLTDDCAKLAEEIAGRLVMGRKEDDHNRGQEDGAKADIFDRAFHNIDPFTSKHYDKGFQHGADSKLESDFITDLFFNPSSSSSPKDEERHTETASTQEYDDEYYDDLDDDDDDYSYSPSSSSQSVPVKPKPEPIVHTTYSRTERGFSVSKMTYNFETEEEKEKYLRMMVQVEEMCGEEGVDKKEDAEQEKLARIFEKIDSDNVLDIIIGAVSLALMKKKE